MTDVTQILNAIEQGDLAAAVNHCRENEIAVMIDLLLGGPGETWESASTTIDFMKRIARPNQFG